MLSSKLLRKHEVPFLFLCTVEDFDLIGSPEFRILDSMSDFSTSISFTNMHHFLHMLHKSEEHQKTFTSIFLLLEHTLSLMMCAPSVLIGLHGSKKLKLDEINSG